MYGSSLLNLSSPWCCPQGVYNDLLTSLVMIVSSPPTTLFIAGVMWSYPKEASWPTRKLENHMTVLFLVWETVVLNSNKPACRNYIRLYFILLSSKYLILSKRCLELHLKVPKYWWHCKQQCFASYSTKVDGRKQKYMGCLWFLHLVAWIIQTTFHQNGFFASTIIKLCSIITERGFWNLSTYKILAGQETP